MTQKLLWILIVLALMVARCAPAAAPQPVAVDKLSVVATFSILAGWVQIVGGDRVEVRALVGPGGDAHTFEPGPADGAALAEARLVFENGLGFEPWLDDLFASSGSQARRVAVTDGIEPRAENEEHVEDAEHPAEGELEHGEFDPHVWHDVRNAIHMVEIIRAALAQADPANQAIYTANAAAYVAQLEELDDWIVEQAATLPQDRRKLVTSHDTFGYFAQRYGFEIIGTALGASTESADPSAGEIARLVDEIKATGVPAIFAENVANPRLMEQIASEAGVELAPTLYTDALGAPGSDGDTYLKLIRYNVTTIVAALQQ
jgi:ABC-type Zn uptake system ZnuABC Zn-binding protein ZnuA